MVNRTTFQTEPPATAYRVTESRTENEPRPEPTAAEDTTVLQTGTTTVAVSTDDAVVVAADQRASLGGQFTSNKRMEKIAPVHPQAAVALSGTVGPLQDFARTLRAESTLYEVRRGNSMPTSALATVASSLVAGLPAQVLLGGVDDRGAHVYELDGGGGVVPAPYAAAGSGMQVAYGTLEGHADDVEDLETARRLALTAIAAASERDTASGNGAHVATITADGVDVDAFTRNAVADAHHTADASISDGGASDGTESGDDAGGVSE